MLKLTSNQALSRDNLGNSLSKSVKLKVAEKLQYSQEAMIRELGLAKKQAKQQVCRHQCHHQCHPHCHQCHYHFHQCHRH